jgi:hypothetical protein
MILRRLPPRDWRRSTTLSRQRATVRHHEPSCPCPHPHSTLTLTPCTLRSPYTLTVWAAVGSQFAHESAYSSSDHPHAYTRAQATQPSHPARRAATARSRHTSHRERGVGTGERTFRGAIWARDHASPSNLAPRLSPAQRASPRVVRALSRRGRGERFRLAYTLTCCAGRPFRFLFSTSTLQMG